MNQDGSFPDHLLRAVLDLLPSFVCVLDSEARIVYANHSGLGEASDPAVTAEQCVGCNYLGLCENAVGAGAEGASAIAAGIRRIQNGETDHFMVEYPCDTPQGCLWFRATARRIPEALSTMVLIQHDDVTKMRAAQMRAEAFALRYQTAMVNSKDGSVVFRPLMAGAELIDFEIEELNGEACRQLGKEQSALLNRRASDALPHFRDYGFFRQFKDVYVRGKSLEQEFRLPLQDTGEGWFRQQVVSMGDRLMVLTRDISSQKRAEGNVLRYREVIAREQKLEVLGLLGAGIAHDLNNVLSGVLSALEIARAKPSSAAHWIDRAREQLLRASAVANQLRSFSRGSAPNATPTDLAPLLRSVAEFALAGSAVELDLHCDGPLPLCVVDRVQISQVIENLCLNARNAMAGGGKLSIECAVDATIDSGSGLDRQCVRIYFSDTGPGIKPALAQRIFEPFFSTTPGGIGLGLWIARRIVEAHGGALELLPASEGARFCLRLRPSAAAELMDAEVVTGGGYLGHGRVLILDDSIALLEVFQAQLQLLGFETLGARTGEEAITLYLQEQAAGKEFVACFLDLTIVGGLGGKETAARLRAAGYCGRLFVMSGYSEEQALARPTEHNFDDRLLKPFTQDQLVDLLLRWLPTLGSG